MKSPFILKLGFCLVMFITSSSLQTDLNAQSNYDKKQQTENNVTVTIDKNTSNADFENIKDMLSEYGIEVDFDNISRNDSNDITSIGIKIASNNSQTSSTISGSRPIQPMSFGSKNGKLFIGDDHNEMDKFAFFNGNNRFSFPMDNDSIFRKRFKSFHFDDFFNGNQHLFMFNGDSIDIKALKDRFFNKFNFDESTGNDLPYFFSDKNDGTSQKFSFIDHPEKDTLIVINGDISDFKTLDGLAKADQLKSVDVLKPDTAMSIYGDKAKDGAIIATTK